MRLFVYFLPTVSSMLLVSCKKKGDNIISSDRENVYATFFEMFSHKGHTLRLSLVKKSDLFADQ